jgi:hypothetical protein
VFQVPPTVSDAGELVFRVSGKPGFQGSSTIILWNDDPTHPYPLGQFQVEVNNEITTTESVAGQGRDNQANISAGLGSRAESLFARQVDPAPEGEEDPPISPPPSPSTPPPPSPSTTPAHLTLAAPDPTAEEPHFIYCGTVNTDGKFTITSDSAWLGGNVQIAVTGGAHLGDDYTLSSIAGLGTAPNGNGGWILTVNLPPYATAPVVEIVVTAKKDNFEVDTPETVQFSWHDTDTATVIHHGSGSTVTISDFLEGLSLTADPSTTSEVTTPPGKFHIQPQTSGCTLCTNATLWIDASGTGDATPGVDYLLQTETGASITLSETSPGSRIYTSNPAIPIANDADFQIKVFALTDSLVEGNETVRATVKVEPLTSSQAVVTIQDANTAGIMRLAHDDPSAEEPYLIYSGTVGQTGTVRILPPAGWPGGSVNINVGGSAIYDTDYTLLVPAGLAYSNGVVTGTVPPGSTPMTITVTAIQDHDETDSGETVEFTWGTNSPPPGITFDGTGIVTILDVLDDLELTAAPATTREPGGPPGKFHITPAISGKLLNIPVRSY